MSFSRESSVSATRKEHRCEACHTTILVGSQAVRWSGMTDGHFDSVIYHTDCREAEIAFNDMHGLGADEWASIGYDRDQDDDEWLVSAFPKVADRLGIMRLP